MADFNIAHLYPDLMNLYGDRGNLLCLKRRLEWYGHNCRIENINLGGSLDFSRIDMIFIGGGSDREQLLVYEDLIKKADQLMAQFDTGLPALCICGAYQLLGKYYRSHDGQTMKGLGFFDFFTQGQPSRLIGNILLNSELNGHSTTVVGFENHGGRTYIEDARLKPFGTVVRGFGNNGEDKSEGMIYRNLIGTYLHGPILPKNPAVADFFIKAMSARKGIRIDRQLNNDIENFAHEQVKQKILG